MTRVRTRISDSRGGRLVPMGTPPNRRSRLPYSRTASQRLSGPKSGQSVGVKKNSEYADCQSRKLLMRCSPEVRMIRSGSGRSRVNR